MKKIIALSGSGNSGKTSTLCIVHKGLLSMAESIMDEHRIDDGDQRNILVINGVNVGIETQGDPNSRLSSSLILFKEHNCHLIICATRTRGSTVEIVDNLAPEYHISWRGQSSLSEASLRDESNQAIANLIINEAKSELNV